MVVAVGCLHDRHADRRVEHLRRDAVEVHVVEARRGVPSAFAKLAVVAEIVGRSTGRAGETDGERRETIDAELESRRAGGHERRPIGVFASRPAWSSTDRAARRRDCHPKQRAWRRTPVPRCRESLLWTSLARLARGTRAVVQISIYGGSDATTVAEVVARVRAAADEGFRSFWLPQTAGLDASDRARGRRAAKFRRSDSVPRSCRFRAGHPIPLAQQALTLADAAGEGRVTLGVGVTHKPVSEGWYGIPYKSVVGLCEEELRALDGLLGASRRADVDGKYVSAHIELPLKVARPGLVLAALGPKMLEIAGRYTDGTVTWMTGVATLRNDVVPRFCARHRPRHLRPAPRVIVGIPVCVTSDVAGARERLGPGMAGTARMASYARMVAAEGVAEPVDIALIGDEDAVAPASMSLGRARA